MEEPDYIAAKKTKAIKIVVTEKKLMDVLQLPSKEIQAHRVYLEEQDHVTKK